MPPALTGYSGNRRFHGSCAGFSRQAVLLFCTALLIALFTVTGFLSRAFHLKQQAIAENWFERGNSSLAAGHARDARDDYRNALIFEPQNTSYQLHLAQALTAYGQPDQSRAYLLNLLTQFPGDGEVNLELAHLATRDGAVTAAIHYFHGAIYGAWDSNPVESRRAARLELCQFLVSRGEYNQAEAELIALAAGIPEDASALHATVGDLFLRAGDTNRALNEFQLSLKVSARNTIALTGAGTAAYRLNNFKQAADYLERAHAENPDNGEITQMLETSRAVIVADPFAPDLSEAERAHRAAKALADAMSRAEKCMAPDAKAESSPLAALLERAKAARRGIWRENGLRLHPEQIPAEMQVAFDIETECDRECGKPEGVDLALTLIRDLRREIASEAPGA
ncbi:MAG: tetratricopeptide repeat protein [Candidatus Acidiferrales bacterium]|jgi:tetratricopeptide (TPR) repeat protein